MSFRVVLGDITKIHATAIVNAANCSLLGGGGVDGAIHRAAGPQLLEECRRLHGCQTGQAKMTGGYRLLAEYVIHTPGPVWRGGNHDEAALLASCYRNCLKIAAENRIKDVAFPSISTGIYGYPLSEAAEIAVRTIHEYPAIEVQMVCFDERTKRVYEQAERAYRKKYDCTDIKETVYIEYENLPMKKVFKHEALKRKILQTAKDKEKEAVLIQRILQADTTFRQYVYLRGKEGLEMGICEKILAAMREEDEQRPVPMTEAYPFLKQDCWSLCQRDISYMKVRVLAGEDGQFDIEEIQKKKTKEGMELLFKIPGKRYRLVLEHTVAEQKVLKCLLLDGEADLKRFGLKGEYILEE